jgi:ribosome-associated protein
MKFVLRREFIELDNMLKTMELVSCGAEAKQLIQEGAVRVNGALETRIRRKLRQGDTVEFGDKVITLVA